MDTAKRNTILHIVDGGCFMGGMVFLDQYTIMTGFIGQITKNPLIISLIPAAIAIGFNVPGLFSASPVQKIKNKHRLVAICGLLQRLMVFALALFTFSLPHVSPLFAGMISVIIYFLFAGMGGLSGPTWVDLLARTVPKGRKSRVIAIRNAIGAATGIVFPLVIGLIIRTFLFPENYRWLFLIGFGFLAVSWIAFIMIQDETPPIVHKEQTESFLPFLKNLPKEDPNFIRFLVSRIIFTICIIGNSFYTIFYLSRNEGVNDSVIAAFAFALNLSKIPGSLILGHLGDQKGNLLVYKLGILAIIPTNLIALFAPSLPVYILLYLFLGLILSADLNTFQSFAGEFGNEKNRIYYISLGNFVAGLFSGIFPIIAGYFLMIRLFSYEKLFIFCTILSMAGLIYTHFRVKEPLHISEGRLNTKD